MKDKDSYLLEELYESLNKMTDASTFFTDEEVTALEEIGEKLENKSDRYEKIRSEYHVSEKGNTAAFKTEGSYSIDTQHETMWEPFSKEIHIEKAAPDLYYVAIDDKIIEVETFSAVLDHIRDNL